MRARLPDVDGFVERNGVKLGYEVFGDGPKTVLLMPTFPIVNSRMWKAQIPFLARHYRVVTFDGPGNGRSDRPLDPGAYTDDAHVAATLAVLDETGTDSAVFVALCSGVRWTTEVAVTHPDRVRGIVAIAPGIPHLTPPLPWRAAALERFDDVVEESAGWAAYENRHRIKNDYLVFLRKHSEFICVAEPHSTKILDDLEEWGLETDPEILLAFDDAPGGELFPKDLEAAEALCRSVRCPTLVIVGDRDACQPPDRGRRYAELTRGDLVVLEGAGHLPHARHPVVVNRLIKELVDGLVGPNVVRSRTADSRGTRTWRVASTRRPRALFLCSPIGLGHALRDVAIAGELRRLRPELEIEWLTQHPVTAMLERRGERIHPASAHLVSETGHIESEAGEHDIRVFEAIRRMDEILVANFMVFQELMDQEPFDLVIGDESWDVDHFLHENPELKRAPFVWMTDFVGWLPMPDGGGREVSLTADYNAEMIEHVERFPRLRDLSVFVGDPEDIVPSTFGPGLPSIREWTNAHYAFCGYVTGFDPASLGDREELRSRLGFGPDERVCVVTVGGSGVGEHLLRRVVAAYPRARERIPGLRMVVVAGPRIDPASLPGHDGLEVHGYVEELYRHLAACDVAIVQGGLTTQMELVAVRRPFLSFPLRHHFEQNLHVRHRIERYGAGRFMDYDEATPETIAAALADELDREIEYLPVRGDGAARAAELVAGLLP